MIGAPAISIINNMQSDPSGRVAIAAGIGFILSGVVIVIWELLRRR